MPVYSYVLERFLFGTAYLIQICSFLESYLKTKNSDSSNLRAAEPATTAWELRYLILCAAKRYAIRFYGGIAACGFKPFRPYSDFYGYYLCKFTKNF